MNHMMCKHYFDNRKRQMEPNERHSHHNQCVLFTGKGDKTQTIGQRHAIHYLSLYDNKILRHFRGHSGDVTDVSMSPVDDCFLTCGADRTVRLWNLQLAGSLAEMDLPKVGGNGSIHLDVDGVPHAAFDSTGLVFGVTAPMAAGSGHVSFYFFLSFF